MPGQAGFAYKMGPTATGDAGGVTPTGDKILTEGGDYILMEDGSKILME